MCTQIKHVLCADRVYEHLSGLVPAAAQPVEELLRVRCSNKHEEYACMYAKIMTIKEVSCMSWRLSKSSLMVISQGCSGKGLGASACGCHCRSVHQASKPASVGQRQACRDLWRSSQSLCRALSILVCVCIQPTILRTSVPTVI